MTRKPKPTPPFARILTALLAERSISNKEASFLAGTSQSTIHDWKNGTSPSDLMAVKRLADALGVSMAYLTTGENDQNSQPHIGAIFDDGPIVFSGYAKVHIQALQRKDK
jgi:hypothetical protein